MQEDSVKINLCDKKFQNKVSSTWNEATQTPQFPANINFSPGASPHWHDQTENAWGGF